jgi:hypothetical protein
MFWEAFFTESGRWVWTVDTMLGGKEDDKRLKRDVDIGRFCSSGFGVWSPSTCEGPASVSSCDLARGALSSLAELSAEVLRRVSAVSLPTTSPRSLRADSSAFWL